MTPRPEYELPEEEDTARETGIERRYLRVIPGLDGLEVDFRQDIAGKLDLSRGNIRQVVDDGDRAAGHGDVQDGAAGGLRRALLVGGHDGVARAEVYGARGNLVDARAGAYCRIVYLRAGEIVVFTEPLGVKRRRECAACAVQVDRLR